MNLKLAKRLRKISAQMATAGLTYLERENVKPEIRQKQDGQGFYVEMVKHQGTLTCHPQSARGIYRRLKKDAKRGQF